MTERSNVTELNERIRQEHDELRNLLRRVHQALEDDTSSHVQITAMLQDLSEHVAVHFQQEETEGFFDQIVRDAPRLVSHVDALRADHTKLLETMYGMKQQAAKRDDSESWRTGLAAAFHSFSKQLMNHESKENELLLDAYGTDIGSKD